jgi:hypothetical protein
LEFHLAAMILVRNRPQAPKEHLLCYWGLTAPIEYMANFSVLFYRVVITEGEEAGLEY